jgi:Domain of unknown function (DUF4129)
VRRGLLALLLVAAVAPCAQGREALAAIDECIAKLDTALDVGYSPIAEHCPELTPALTQSPWAPWLPADWQREDNQLSASSLSELRTLLSRAAQADAPRRTPPRTQRVAGVLAALVRHEPVPESWWTRFKLWLRRILTPQPQEDQGWVRRLLAGVTLSRNSLEWIGWGSLVLVVALALGVVINELRMAGLLGPRARHAPGVRAGEANDPADLRLEDIERAAPAQQPALLLAFITLQLIAQERLPPARALTARELARRARLPDQSGHASLAQLLTVCERIRFSGTEVDAESRASALRSGRALLTILAALPPVAAPA